MVELNEVGMFMVAFTAVLWRTIMPFIKKKAMEPDISFDKKYLWTAFLAIGISLVMCLMSWHTFSAADNLTPLQAISSAFCFGYTINAMTNHGINMFE